MARRRSRLLGRIVGLAAASVLSSAPAAAEPDGPGLYLFRVPAARGAGPLGPRLEAELEVANPDRLAGRLAATSVTVLAVTDDGVRVAIDMIETLVGEPLPRHTEASFVVDFDEPAVLDLGTRMREKYGASPSRDELTEFVDATIATKSYRRSFDLASQVARSHEGDCTEHAVLLAAMARSVHRPARVVLGVMLLENDGALLAFGHAWAEIHDGQTWHIADATFPERLLAGARPRYLPLMELANEGPGYGLGLVNLAALQPSRIDAAQAGAR